jgi:hypothetical protein
MDLTRLPAIPPKPPAAPQPARDVGAAQRAFFRAALGPAADPEPATPAAPAPKAASETTAQQPETPRILRPGSIIDIRI